MSTIKDYAEQYAKLPMKKNLTEKEALAAVKQDGYALQYVPGTIKTEAVCLAAVKQNCYVLRYVPESSATEAVCLAAVKQNGDVLRYVPAKFFV